LSCCTATSRFSVDGESCSLADVLDELRSVGLMATHKFVVLDKADTFLTRTFPSGKGEEKMRSAIERYAADPEPTATLVMRAETWRPGNLDKRIAKVGQVCKFARLKAPEATRWLIDRVARVHGGKIAKPAAAALVEQVGVDLARLDTEAGKLACAVESDRPIELADVQALGGRASEEKGFVLQSALLSGKPAEAVRTLHELNQLSGQHEQFLHWVAADLVRKLAAAVDMLEQRTDEKTICTALKIFPFDMQRPFFAAARRLGRPGTARLLGRLTEMDARAKSGFAEQTRNLEMFCVSFAAALR